MSKNYNNEILNDCAWFAEKNKQSGPHWSTIIRFTPLFDEAARLQQRVDTLEAYIDDFTPDSMQIAKLKQCIAELEAERRWIPVSERLPEECVYVQVTDGKDVFQAKMYLKYGKPKWVWQGYEVDNVTHWQSLPNPPQEEE